MRIQELLIENNQIDEISLKGIGQSLGTAAGAVGSAVGGVQGAWQGMKNAYGQKRDRVAKVAQRNVQRAGGYREPPKSTTAAPTAQTATSGAPVSGTQDPNALRQQAAALNQQADQIERQQQQAAPAPSPAPAPSGTNAPAPSGTNAPAQEPTDPGQDYGLGKQSDGKFIKPGQKFDTANGSPIAPAPASTPETPPATEPAPAPATPPAAETPPTTGSKLTKAQQDAKKAELLGKRQAGKTTATQTGGGFKDYVGGSGERMTGVDASGAPIYQKIQREGVEFRSNFLGMMI
jgi:hypothetical protein